MPNDCSRDTSGSCAGFSCDNCMTSPSRTSYIDQSGCVACAAGIIVETDTTSESYGYCQCQDETMVSYLPIINSSFSQSY